MMDDDDGDDDDGGGGGDDDNDVIYIYIHMAVDGDEDHYDQARSEAIGRVPKRGPYHLNATWSSSHCLMIFDAVFRLPLELPPP